jgi:hypothetical protein
MMKYELAVVSLIPMGMVVLPCNIIVLFSTCTYNTFQYHNEKYEYFQCYNLYYTNYFFIASNDWQHAFRSKITLFSNTLYELVNPAVDGYIFRCILKTVKSGY